MATLYIIIVVHSITDCKLRFFHAPVFPVAVIIMMSAFVAPVSPIVLALQLVISCHYYSSYYSFSPFTLFVSVPKCLSIFVSSLPTLSLLVTLRSKNIKWKYISLFRTQFYHFLLSVVCEMKSCKKITFFGYTPLWLLVTTPSVPTAA